MPIRKDLKTVQVMPKMETSYKSSHYSLVLMSIMQRKMATNAYQTSALPLAACVKPTESV